MRTGSHYACKTPNLQNNPFFFIINTYIILFIGSPPLAPLMQSLLQRQQAKGAKSGSSVAVQEHFIQVNTPATSSRQSPTTPYTKNSRPIPSKQDRYFPNRSPAFTNAPPKAANVVAAVAKNLVPSANVAPPSVAAPHANTAAPTNIPKSVAPVDPPPSSTAFAIPPALVTPVAPIAPSAPATPATPIAPLAPTESPTIQAILAAYQAVTLKANLMEKKYNLLWDERVAQELAMKALAVENGQLKGENEQMRYRIHDHENTINNNLAIIASLTGMTHTAPASSASSPATPIGAVSPVVASHATASSATPIGISSPVVASRATASPATPTVKESPSPDSGAMTSLAPSNAEASSLPVDFAMNSPPVPSSPPAASVDPLPVVHVFRTPTRPVSTSYRSPYTKDVDSSFAMARKRINAKMVIDAKARNSTKGKKQTKKTCKTAGKKPTKQTTPVMDEVIISDSIPEHLTASSPASHIVVPDTAPTAAAEATPSQTTTTSEEVIPETQEQL